MNHSQSLRRGTSLSLGFEEIRRDRFSEHKPRSGTPGERPQIARPKAPAMCVSCAVPPSTALTAPNTGGKSLHSSCTRAPAVPVGAA